MSLIILPSCLTDWRVSDSSVDSVALWLVFRLLEGFCCMLDLDGLLLCS